MIKINTKNCKESGFKLSMLGITKLIEKKKIRDEFNIKVEEKGNRYHYYTDEKNYIRFKDFVSDLKKQYKRNKRRKHDGETNYFNTHNLRKEY